VYKIVPAMWALFKISYEDKYNLPMNKEFLSKEKIKDQYLLRFLLCALSATLRALSVKKE
jgi:hypothetical protein